MGSLQELMKYMEVIISDMKIITEFAEDFAVGSQETLNRKINGLVDNLLSIDKVRSDVSHIRVPFAVCDYIDKDISPEEYLNDLLKKLTRTQARIELARMGYRQLKTHLLYELCKHFPDDMSLYIRYRPNCMDNITKVDINIKSTKVVPVTKVPKYVYESKMAPAPPPSKTTSKVSVLESTYVSYRPRKGLKLILKRVKSENEVDNDNFIKPLPPIPKLRIRRKELLEF